MPNPAYVKSEPGWWASEGLRIAGYDDLYALDEETQDKIYLLLEVMEWPMLVVFLYGDSDRLVAPFVVGVSSEGNPLLRGYQLEGYSKSGKGEGWRVFQISKIENLESYQEFFDANDFDFEGYYPWIYKVFKMIEGGEKI